MSVETNKQIVRRYQQLINNADWEALDEVLAPDVATPLMMPGFPPGRDGAKAIGRATLHAWPDFQTRIEELIAEDDRVVALITCTGTAVNPGFGLPGTGKPFTMTGAYIVRIAGNQIVEHTGIEDALGMLHQIGVM